MLIIAIFLSSTTHFPFPLHTRTHTHTYMMHTHTHTHTTHTQTHTHTVWNTHTWREVYTLVGHTLTVVQMCFSPNDTYAYNTQTNTHARTHIHTNTHTHTSLTCYIVMVEHRYLLSVSRDRHFVLFKRDLSGVCVCV